MDIDECRRSSVTSEISEVGGGFSWKSILGILCTLMTSILFTGLNVISKVIYNTSNITAFEMAYLRCLTTIVGNTIYAQFVNVDVLSIPKTCYKTLLKRIFCATSGFIFGFLALKLMTYSEYMSISYVYPMLTQITAYLLLREKLTIYDIISCITSFSGVIIIALNYKSGSSSENSTLWVFSVPLIAAVSWALGDVYQRKIKDRIHYVASPVYQCLGGCIGCSILALITDSKNNIFTHYDIRIFLLVFAAGVFGSLGTMFYALSFQYEKAGRLAVFNYLIVPYALLIDYFYFKIDLGWYNVLGGLLIISGSSVITFLKGFGYIG